LLGGAIYFGKDLNITRTIQNCTFFNNKATLNNGLDIYAATEYFSASTFDIVNSCTNASSSTSVSRNGVAVSNILNTTCSFQTQLINSMCELPLLYLDGDCVYCCPDRMVGMGGKCYFGCEYKDTQVSKDLNGECSTGCLLVNDYECNITSCEDIDSSSHCNDMNTDIENACVFIFDKNELTGSCLNKINITECSVFHESSQCVSHGNINVNNCIWIEDDNNNEQGKCMNEVLLFINQKHKHIYIHTYILCIYYLII
jgi:hypothetical protein